MNAIVYRQYGQPDVMTLEEVPTPVPEPSEVLVQIHATTVNSYDWDLLTGSTWVTRIGAWKTPRFPILGCDVSGTVAAIGDDVEGFTVGDAVIGDLSSSGFGGFAEFVAVRPGALSPKPTNLSHEEAASLPHTGTLALQALARANIGPKSNVLINGGGGGAGTFAIQMAKHAGATVTAVDSAPKGQLMAQLGADRVLDYRQTDFTKEGKRYDLIMDVMSRRGPFAYRRCLNAGGAVVLLGGRIRHLLSAVTIGWVLGRRRHTHMSVLVHKPGRSDLEALTALAEASAIRPTIDSVTRLADLPTALAKLGAGETLGKAIVRVVRRTEREPA